MVALHPRFIPNFKKGNTYAEDYGVPYKEDVVATPAVRMTRAESIAKSHEARRKNEQERKLQKKTSEQVGVAAKSRAKPTQRAKIVGKVFSNEQ